MKLESFEPTEKNVSKIVDRYKSAELPRMERLYDYYNNQHSIEDRVMESGKPNNKLAHDYCRYITDTTSGYFMGINVKISSTMKNTCRSIRICAGITLMPMRTLNWRKKCQHLWLCSRNHLFRMRWVRAVINALIQREMILIFGAKLEDYLLAAIRFYTVKDLDGNEIEYADIYQPDSVLHMMRKAGQASFETLGEEVHTMAKCQ